MVIINDLLIIKLWLDRIQGSLGSPGNPGSLGSPGSPGNQRQSRQSKAVKASGTRHLEFKFEFLSYFFEPSLREGHQKIRKELSRETIPYA
jgi:hypothetical protein